MANKQANARNGRLLALTVIILIGVFFRLKQIQTIPPGDGFDPAYYGLDALRILAGEYPIYLATNFGREVLFSYLVALVYAIIGSGTLGIHLASAFVSILTIPAVFLVTDEFFKHSKQRIGQQVGGLLAATIVAFSFWHLTWSRYSVRAILIPLFVSLLCFFLLRALRKQQTRYFVLTGLIVGLGFYTYQLAQLFPILVALGIIYDLIARRSLGKKDVVHVGLLVGTAVCVASPLAIYAAQNPDIFNQRVTAVYVLNDTPTLAEQAKIVSNNLWQVAKMYTIAGDTDPLINIPGRPSLNPFLSLALLVGLLIAIYRWRRPHYLFLLTWFFLMTAPAVLAEAAAMSKRALGALPAATILNAVGLLLPLDWLSRRQMQSATKKKRIMAGYVAILALGLLFTAINTYRDFFFTWGTDPGMVTHYNVGIADIGKYMRTIPEDETIYLSPTWIDHATLKLHSDNRTGIHAYNGRHCFVFPAETTSQTNFIIVPDDEGNSLPLLQSYWPQGQITHEGYLNEADPYFVVYTIPPQTVAQFEPQQRHETKWENEIGLVGYDISATTFHPGDTITVNLYMQPLTDMARNYTAFLHLLGTENPASGNALWGQVDREPCFQSYPTSWWQEGEIMRDTFTLNIAPDAPAGTYSLAMGFYHWPELTRLTVAQGTDVGADQELLLKDAIQIVVE